MKPTQSGMTLIEVIAVMAILAIGASLAARVAVGIYRDALYDELIENVELVLAATNSYYENMCSAGTTPAPTIAVLVGRDFLESAERANNPFGNQLQPVVLWGVPSRIEVRAVITSGSAAEIRNVVGADRVSGNTLFWTKLPTVLTNKESFEIMQMKHVYQPNVCR